MKKLLLIFLALVMMFSIVACGEDKSDDDDDRGDRTKTTTTQSSNSTTTNGDTQKPTNDKSDADVNEFVAVDNDECSIILTDMYYDDIWGLTFNAELENKSSDKQYTFSVDYASVNGVMCDPMFYADVDAGTKVSEEISVWVDDFDDNCGQDYTDIALTFSVYDSNDYVSDSIVYETVHIYPYGENKAVKFVRESESTDNVIVDDEYVTVIVTGYEVDDYYGYTVNLFFLNKSDKDLSISANDVFVNGIDTSPLCIESVLAGNCAFGTMVWMGELEEEGITDVEEIEFTVTAYDINNWFDGELVNQPVVLNP